MSDCPYLKDVDDDLLARDTWSRKDEEIMKRRLGERPKKRNKPYPGAPNPVERLIDDNTTDKTDQEISMIMNAPIIAIFIPIGQRIDPSVVTQAQNGFNTYLRHLCGYRPKKEEAVDTKNARGFAVTKVIREEHPDWGLIPSFETVDPRDCIAPVTAKADKEPERITCVLRYGRREFEDLKDQGYSKEAIDVVLEKLTTKDAEDRVGVSESSYDDKSTFKVTRELVGINSSDVKHNQIVVWEVYHYATKWDVENSNDIVKEGDKCVSYVCPDVPDQLLKVMPWREEDDIELIPKLEDGVPVFDEFGNEDFDIEEIQGKDRRWPLIQHRYSYRSRLWYDTEGIGHKNMDLQIKATALERAILIMIDYISDPKYKNTGTENQANIVSRPGAVLPQGIEPADESGRMQVLNQLNFMLDQTRRAASSRAGIAGGIYSSMASESRKLEKTATEVQSENATSDIVSSASVDRFNDPDREMFRQLWDDMKRLRVRLPVIDNGQFQGFIDDTIYQYDFLIIPAASQKTLNPDLQFQKANAIMNSVVATAEVTGADLAGGYKHIIQQADPVLAAQLFPQQEGGEMPITSTLNALSQQVEQLSAAVQQNATEIDQVTKLSEEVAGVRA